MDGDVLGVDVVGGAEGVEGGGVVGGAVGGAAEPEPEAPPDGELGVVVGEELVEGGALDVVEPAGAVALWEPVEPVLVPVPLGVELADPVAACVV